MQPSEPGAEVIHGNALDLPLPDNSVDLIITSPPYFALRSYRDGDEHYGGQIGSEATPQEFLEALWAATREMVRVLKPSGSIWVNLGDKYAGSGGHNNAAISRWGTLPHKQDQATNQQALRDQNVAEYNATRRNAPDRYNQNSGGIPAKSLMGLPWRYAIGCIDQLGLILRAEVIWSKPNGLPESVTDRVRRSHEQWFMFTKQGRYFSAVDEVREAHIYPDDTRHLRGGRRSINPDGSDAGGNTSNGNPLGKLPGSVWTIPSEPLIIPDAVKAHYGLPDHFAAFPQEWPRRIILGWSPSGVCVACGEGRRPVSDKQYLSKGAAYTHDDTEVSGRHRLTKRAGDGEVVSITGYACACTDTTRDCQCPQPNPDCQHPTCPRVIPPTRPAVVLDPFGGTGTVAMVARALGRYGISVDLSADYCRLAEWRIFHSGHAAKTEERTNRDRQAELF